MGDTFCIVYIRFYKIVFYIIETIPWKPNLFFNISIDPIYFYSLYSAHIYIDDRGVSHLGDLSGISKVFLILFVGVGLFFKKGSYSCFLCAFKRIERLMQPTLYKSVIYKGYWCFPMRRREKSSAYKGRENNSMSLRLLCAL